MAITATEEGRNLLIVVEDDEQRFEYRIRPLPGGAGHQITETYLATARGELHDEAAVTEALTMALNGARYDAATERWTIPDDLPVSEQLERELRLAETESVAYCAFYWQTIVGIAGVNAFLEGGEGVAGQVKALWVMTARMGLSTSRPSPLSALDTLTSMVSTPSTSSRAGGEKRGKQPRDRPAKKRR